MSMQESFKLLKKYKCKLTRQQTNTFKGQILKGDIIGFEKGLNKIIRRIKDDKRLYRTNDSR